MHILEKQPSVQVIADRPEALLSELVVERGSQRRDVRLPGKEGGNLRDRRSAYAAEERPNLALTRRSPQAGLR
jgi:hypothetical protein